MNSPQRKLVLFPLKSLRYQTSSDCNLIVPASVGENELGECVMAPATLISDEIYFLNPGKTLQLVVKKDKPNINTDNAILKVFDSENNISR